MSKDKEFILLNRITNLFRKKDMSIPELLQSVTLLLPTGWQYPEIAAAQIIYGDMKFATPKFSIMPWIQTAKFGADDKAGVINISYLEDRPLKHEGPYLLEERHLIDHIANILRIYLEFRETKEALILSEHNLSLLKNSIPAIIYKGYVDWSMDAYDNKVEEITGYPKDLFDSRQIKWSDIMFKEDLDAARAIFIEALRTSKAYVREFRVRHKNGEVKWIQERAYIVCDQAGKIDYVCGIFFDISQRRRAEEELARYQKHLEQLVEERTYELITANRQLQVEIAEREEALANVKLLSGLLPICASCKKIRDDKGYWNRIETYISEHSEALFTHGFCPDCVKKLYPEHFDNIYGQENK